jgi:hypothetical protein
VTTCVLQRQFELGHDNGDCLGNQWFSCPIDGNRFGFQRMDDKVKDELVLSVIWR